MGQAPEENQFIALYHDHRGVSRQLAMCFDDGHWAMTREDSDFHQRFIADIKKDRIDGRRDASENQGKSWRKDFDFTFERTTNDRGDD